MWIAPQRLVGPIAQRRTITSMRIDWRSPAALGLALEDHFSRYPLMQSEDVYKLLYQGILGSEHLVSSPDEFAARLQQEYDAESAKDVELLWEAVRPDGALGRLNLRPFKAQSGSLEVLTRACLETAEQVWGAPQDLRDAWTTFVALCRSGHCTVFSLPQVLGLAARLEEQDYPAVHHSPRYTEAYHPAYRLVAGEWILSGYRDANRAIGQSAHKCAETDALPSPMPTAPWKCSA